MTLDELATYTGVCRRTCERWAKDHGMPMHGGKRNRYIDRHDFLNWAARHAFVRDAVKEPAAVRDITIYHKAALYDLMYS